jgi:ABC-type multidrug transport system ATPase subunit
MFLYSTLLDLLADRKLDGQISGEIYFNHSCRARTFHRNSAYILQDDLHFPTLTVRETIYYSACFKLTAEKGSTSVSHVEAITSRVNELLKLMGLSHVADSLVGDANRKGISGGQRKRLSIAVEIVSFPELIFLDEPTSGLDAIMAYDVMKVVHSLTQNNRTCITTIHQPSPEVFALFDKVVLLCEGKLVYYGSTKFIVDYFTSEPLNYYYDTTSHYNPAEFIIDIGEGIIKPIDSEKPLSIEELERYYLSSKYRYIPPSKEAIDLASSSKNAMTASTQSLHSTSVLSQFIILTKRNVKTMTRDVPEILTQLLKNIIVGLLIGVVFYQQAQTTTPLFTRFGIPEDEVENISSLLFFGLMFIMYSNVQGKDTFFPSFCLFFLSNCFSFPFFFSYFAMLVVLFSVFSSYIVLFLQLVLFCFVLHS